MSAGEKNKKEEAPLFYIVSFSALEPLNVAISLLSRQTQQPRKSVAAAVVKKSQVCDIEIAGGKKCS